MNPQGELFMNGYSYQTSLPAYREAPQTKQIQLSRIIALVTLGACSLKELAQKTGLPQSTVSGRVNDGVKEGVLRYDGFVIYDGRKRKCVKLVWIKR